MGATFYPYKAASQPSPLEKQSCFIKALFLAQYAREAQVSSGKCKLGNGMRILK